MKDQRKLKVVVGQVNPIVGDIEFNCQHISKVIEDNPGADLIVFPEMALVGYPLMDHILDPIIREKNKEALESLTQLETESTIILGTFTEPPELEEKFQCFYNSAVVIENHEIIHVENKRLIPNYDVFDERRYFSFDDKFQPVQIKGVNVGVLICEDIWDESYDIKVAEELVSNGAEFLVVINASPYHIDKFNLRKDLLKRKSSKLSTPILYVNMVGGLDEITYDGQSFLTNRSGEISFRAKAFEEDFPWVDIHIDREIISSEEEFSVDWRKQVLKALKLNLHDYFHKTGIFKGTVVGLSGGIDSAFTSYVCAEALGPEKVTNIMMPTRFTSEESIDLARQLCDNLGMNYKIHPIDEVFESHQSSIEEHIGDLPFDVADENLQARIRAVILMYYSNKFDWLLVSTGNKSEIGVGYCTLYGDTCGGKNVPGDLLKVQIYDLCDYINRDREIIPAGIIERPPTAELKEDQKDTDSLPPYEILDQILNAIIENGLDDTYEELEERGIERETIKRVQKLYLNSEYKRRQLVQTIKVSESAFGIGRRYPVLKRLEL